MCLWHVCVLHLPYPFCADPVPLVGLRCVCVYVRSRVVLQCWRHVRVLHLPYPSCADPVPNGGLRWCCRMQPLLWQKNYTLQRRVSCCCRAAILFHKKYAKNISPRFIPHAILIQIELHCSVQVQIGRGASCPPAPPLSYHDCVLLRFTSCANIVS